MSMESMGGCGPSTAQAAQAMRGQRPDPAQMAQKLFDKLDTSGQGYLTRSDLQSALDTVSLSSKSGSSTTSVDQLMKQLDGNGDGKVTEQEFSDALKNAAQQVHAHRGGHGHRAAGGRDHDGDGDDTGNSSATSSAGNTSTAQADSDQDSAKALLQVMKLLRSYQAGSAAATPAAATAQGVNTSA
jgi:hypothetical protein